MPAGNRKLDQFISTIISDANAESSGILKEIDTRRSAFLEKAEDDLLAEMYQYIRAKSAEIRTAAGRGISKKTMDNKRVLFNHRSDIAKNVMNDVKALVREYVQKPEYLRSLELFVRSAADKLGADDLQILLRPDDMKYAAQLAAATPAAYMPGEIELGGIIAKSPSKSIQIDLTYDASFGDASERFGEISGFGV